jgi:hypothetical protein
MDKQNVLVGLAVIGALASSGYALFNGDKQAEKLIAEVSKLKQDQARVVDDVEELIETYDAVNNSLTYNEAGISIAMEDIAKQEDILTSLTVNDSILLDEINDVKAGQDEQAKELLAVKELATAVPIVPQPIVEVVTAPVVVVEPEPEPEPVVVVAPEPEPEPVVYFCPKPDSGVNFGKYISRLSFNKAVKFTVSFDIQDGTVANVSFTPEVTKKLNRAVSRYLNDSIIPINNVTDCSLPFTIAV